MVTNGPQDNGTTRSVAVGEEVVIELPEPALGGYRWNLRLEPEDGKEPAFDVVEERRGPAKPGSGSVGGTGRHVWRLRAGRAGTTVVRGACARQFGSDPPASTFEMTLRAE
jgi:predicted secreted protein